MLRGQYGESDAERIADGLGKRRPVTLRVNTLKADPERVRARLDGEGIAYQDVPWSREALIIRDDREPRIRKLDLYENGEIYLQSLSSMIPAILAEPRAGETILDMAAAPGGKTTQMAALSGGRAQITACEKNKVRSDRLRFNLDRQGAGSVLVMNCDARKLDPCFSFDKILLDAPCSGSGTLYLPQADPAFTEELVRRSVRTQEALLSKALALLKRGGELIYSTCSVLECENESVVRRAVSSSLAELVPLKPPGETEDPDPRREEAVDEDPELSAGRIPLLPTSLPGTLCICPTGYYEGFFVAKLRRR